MGKNKVPKTPEQREAKKEIMAAKRRLKVRKKETQCLKALQKAAKKAKDFQLAKLRRRLKKLLLANEEEGSHVNKPTEGSSSGEANKPAAGEQEAHQEQHDLSQEEEDSSKAESESKSRKEAESSSDEEEESSSDEEPDSPPTPASNQQDPIKLGKKGNKRKQMEMHTGADAKPASDQATPKKKRKGGNGPGKVLPSEDNGHIMSEDAPPHFPPCGNGQLIKASNGESQGSKNRDPLKYETSTAEAVQRQMEVGKMVAHHAVAVLAGQKLGMFLVKEEVPDLRLDPAVDESVVQAELRPFAERMLANAAMRRALEECKEVITKVHAVQERWDTRDERRAEKAAKKAARAAERAAQGLPEESDGDKAPPVQNTKQRRAAARKEKREERLRQKAITRERRQKQFKLKQAAISRGDGTVKYLKPYEQKRLAKEQGAQGMLPKRNKAKYGAGKGGKKDKKKEGKAPAGPSGSAADQKSGDNAGIHPSWAAKKQQSGMMGHLPKAQGKKVVFDE